MMTLYLTRPRPSPRASLLPALLSAARHGSSRRSALLIALACFLCLILGRPAPIHAAAAPLQPGEVMTLSAMVERSPLHPGDQFAVAIIMDFKEGWHAWPNKPVPPPELGDDFDAIPTVIRLVGTPPAGVEVHTGFIQWPKPHGIVTSGVTGSPIEILSYDGRAVAFVPVTLATDIKAGEQTLTFEVSYQACDDSVCMQPTKTTASVVLSVTPVAAGSISTPTSPELFKDFDIYAFSRIASGEKPDVPAASTPDANTTGAPGTPPAADLRPSLFGFDLPAATSPLGVVVLFLAAFIGGAVLNLTPCVLPVIPIKVMTLSQHAGGSLKKTLMLGFWMALGVTAFWVAIGIPMAIVGAAADPSRWIFGTWWVLLGLGVAVVAAGLGIMGLFTLSLPNSLYMVNPKADSPWGSFVFGIMTAVFGLPCFGLVAGGLLAIVATVPGIITMVIFAGIGMGMAAPYLILAAFPKLVEKIPRTGPASELVKQVMGLLLLAAAAYFIAAGFNILISGKPYLKHTISWWAVAFFVLLAGVWLTLRTLQISKKAWPKLVMPLIAAAGVLLFAGIASSLTTTARLNYEKQLAAGGGAGGDRLIPGVWVHWKPEHVEQARSSGKVVIADFTATWCINCVLWKQKFLDTNPVAAELASGEYLMLEVDLSATDAPGWTWLRELGRTAVPTVIVFEPGLKNPTIFNAYTSETIMDALKKAKNAGKTAAAVK